VEKQPYIKKQNTKKKHTSTFIFIPNEMDRSDNAKRCIKPLQTQPASIGQSSAQQKQKRPRAGSDENTLEDINARISSQATAQVSSGVKRQHDEEEVSQAKKQKTDQDYRKGGLVHSLHGLYRIYLTLSVKATNAIFIYKIG